MKTPKETEPVLLPSLSRHAASVAAARATAAMAPPPIGVFVAEGHRITLWGLQQLIGTSARTRMTVTGSALTAGEMLEHDALGQSDIVLFGLDLDGGEAARALQRLQQRTSAKIILLTRDENHEARQAAVLQGARGVLHKNLDGDILLRAIEKVHQGEVWLERSLLSRVLEQAVWSNASPAAEVPVAAQTPRSSGGNQDARLGALTPRERTIVEAVGSQSGAKLPHIAHQLGMSEHTLRNHLTTIYSKLGLRNRLELYQFAAMNSLLT